MLRAIFMGGMRNLEPNCYTAFWPRFYEVYWETEYHLVKSLLVILPWLFTDHNRF